jgi:hypothetical protein
MRHYQVRDVMTANPMTVTPATPLKNVADILVRGRIGVVPVLTPQGRVAGVVAEGDLLRKEQLQRDPDGRHSMHLPCRTALTSWRRWARRRTPATHLGFGATRAYRVRHHAPPPTLVPPIRTP